MYIAVDIGGTNTRVASFQNADPKTQLDYQKFHTEQNYQKGLDNLESAINDLSKNGRLDAISIAIASGLSSEGRSVVDPNIPEWKAEDLVSNLKNIYKTQVEIINDGTAGTLAESVLGTGKYLASFTFLTWGTGLGGATIKKSGNEYDIYEYEPGHLKIEGDGRACECGKKDCIESYVGGKAVEKALGKKMSEMDEEDWDEILGYMSKGIRKILEKHMTHHIVLGGNIILRHPDFVQKLESMTGGNIKFEQSLAGDNAPLYGALIYLRQDLNINFHKEF